MKKTFLPQEFRQKFSSLLGEESQEFFKYCALKIPKSIWVNSLRIKPAELRERLESNRWKLEKLFHENAFLLENVEKPGQSWEFRQGLFNLQEKASMLPAIALAPERNDTVLDACSAPGNKTLQLSCLMQGKGRIVAVEKNSERFKSLAFNVKKFGMKNVLLKRMNLLDAMKKELFDKVLLDAPCSSEGLVRKDFDALKNWSQKLVEKKSLLQKKLIQKAFQLLKKNGTMVYSTCSLSPEENEEVLQFLLEKEKAEIEKIKINGFKARNGLLSYNGREFSGEMQNAVRILPQDNNSQAFFFAKIRKIL